MSIVSIAQAMIVGFAFTIAISFVYFLFNQFVQKSVTENTRGQLYYGIGMLALTLIASASTFVLLWFIFFSNIDAFKMPLLLVGVTTGVMAVYCWSEIIFTKGTFDAYGITLYRLTKKRHHPWTELKQVEFDPEAYWYAMHFKNAKPIKISMMLKGYGDLLRTLETVTGQTYKQKLKEPEEYH